MSSILKIIFIPFKYLFKHIYLSVNWLLDNLLGFIITKEYRSYNKAYKNINKTWVITKRIITIIFVLFLIFSFEFIYKYSLGIVNTFVLQLIGRFFGLPIFNNKLNSFSIMLIEYGPRFSDGIGVTLYLSLIGTTIGFIVALFFSNIVVMKTYITDSRLILLIKRVSQKIINIYVTIIRGTPMMVQAMIIYWGTIGFMQWDYKIAGLVVVSLNTTAYLTEVLRGGIESIDKGQTEGALSLGLSPFQTMFHVVLPQAVKNSMASIGNEFVINIKDTAVLSSILVVDIYRVAEIASGRYLDSFTPFIIAAGIYLVLTLSVTKLLRLIEDKFELPETQLPSSN